MYSVMMWIFVCVWMLMGFLIHVPLCLTRTYKPRRNNYNVCVFVSQCVDAVNNDDDAELSRHRRTLFSLFSN